MVTKPKVRQEAVALVAGYFLAYLGSKQQIKNKMTGNQTFRALVVRETEDGQFPRSIEERTIDSLPEGEVLIRVKFAALNYKDALSATGNKGITRQYPHTPGIDAAGIVADSQDKRYKAGDEVLVTGYDLGMNTSGGFAEYIRVPAGWVVALPSKLTMREAMILGTGGFTAGLALWKMEQNGQQPDMGPVLVTGATGGVGSLAVSILHQAGYKVMASTGKADAHDYLRKLGADELISREEVDDRSKRPLLRSKWAGAIDTIGGNTLATAIRACMANGNVAACGLVADAFLEMNVFAFIIKNVNLLGVASAETPMEWRLQVWEKLANDWRPPHLEAIYRPCQLEDINERIDQMLAGKITGRHVIVFD